MMKRLPAWTPCLMVLGAACAAAQEAPGNRPPAPPLASSPLWSRMTADVARIASEVDGRVGVFIQSLQTGDTFSLRGDEAFPAASTIKLALLFELYRQSGREEGGAKLSDGYLLQPRDLVADSAILGNMAPGTRLTNQDLALFTVVVSDNSATNILVDRLGMARVNATLEALGLQQTRLRRKMMDLQAARQGRENLSSPADLAGILAAIHRGPLLGPDARAGLMRLLATPKAGFLTRLLPDDLVVANKPGVLSGVRNDAGIVFVKGHPFVIAVMASHLRDERQGEAAIAEIGRRAAAFFEVAAAASPEGRLFAPLQVR